MFARRDYIIINIVCLILGFIIVRQFYLHKQVTQVSQPESGNSMALEVTELIKTNDTLRKEINKLTENKNKLNESTNSSQKAYEVLQEDINTYNIILGLTSVEGPGAEITFDDKLDSTQVVDLINAIKNIGAEAISINNRRLSPNTTLEQGIFYPPTTIQVIGDVDILKDSLVRPGGIIEQIGTGSVEKKDKLLLKSI